MFTLISASLARGWRAIFDRMSRSAAISPSETIPVTPVLRIPSN